MRLTPLLALIVLSSLLVNLINAQRGTEGGGSRLTPKRCKASSSPRSPSGRGSTRCRPCVGRRCPPQIKTTTTRSTSTSTSKPNNSTTRRAIPKKRRTTTTRTSGTTRSTSTSTPKRGLPTKRRRTTPRTTGTSKASRKPSKRVPPKKRRTTTNRPVSQTNEDSEPLPPDCITDKSRARRSACLPTSGAPKKPVKLSSANLAKHYVDPALFNAVVALAAKVPLPPKVPPPLSKTDKELIDKFGAERFEELTKDIADRTGLDETKNFATQNTVLSRGVLWGDELDLDDFDPKPIKDIPGQTKKDASGKDITYDYAVYRSKNKVKYIQITWVKHKETDGKTNKKDLDKREEGHFEIEVLEHYIVIGIDTLQPGSVSTEVSHLEPDVGPPTSLSATLEGTNPYDYNVDPTSAGSKTGGKNVPKPGTGRGKGGGRNTHGAGGGKGGGP